MIKKFAIGAVVVHEIADAGVRDDGPFVKTHDDGTIVDDLILPEYPNFRALLQRFLEVGIRP